MEKTTDQKGLKVLLWSLCLLFSLVLFPRNLKIVPIGFLAIVTLVLWFKNNRIFYNRFFLINSFFYGCIAITFLYSDNTAYGLRKLTGLLTFLIFPLIFAMIPQQYIQGIYQKRHRLYWVFLISVFVFNVGAFLGFMTSLSYSWDQMMQHFPTLLTKDLGKWNIHPIYMSMYIGVSILFSLYLVRSKLSGLKIVSLVVMNITLLLFLLLYAKKGPLVALVIVFSLFIFFQKNRKLVKPYILGLVLLIAATIFIPRTRDRFMELIKIENVEDSEVTSTNIRYSIYQASVDAALQSPLIGFGIGDYNDILQAQYAKEGNTILVAGDYNAHNQYVSLWLIGGILLVLLFIIVLAIHLIFAIRFDNQILILLLIFYAIAMLSENLLEREHGVILFSFFLAFFGLFSSDKIVVETPKIKEADTF